MILYMIVFVVLVLILITAAIISITQKDLMYAVLGTSVVSLVLSIFFFLLQAPDVALTEAAIGVALTTIIFVITIRNTKRYEGDETQSSNKNN